MDEQSPAVYPLIRCLFAGAAVGCNPRYFVCLTVVLARDEDVAGLLASTNRDTVSMKTTTPVTQ